MKTAAIFLFAFLICLSGQLGVEGAPGECSMAQYCIEVYRPVCAIRGGEFKTFSNICFLNGEGCRQGWEFYAEGSCGF